MGRVNLTLQASRSVSYQSELGTDSVVGLPLAGYVGCDLRKRIARLDYAQEGPLAGLQPIDREAAQLGVEGRWRRAESVIPSVDSAGVCVQAGLVVVEADQRPRAVRDEHIPACGVISGPEVRQDVYRNERIGYLLTFGIQHILWIPDLGRRHSHHEVVSIQGVFDRYVEHDYVLNARIKAEPHIVV